MRSPFDMETAQPLENQNEMDHGSRVSGVNVRGTALPSTKCWNHRSLRLGPRNVPIVIELTSRDDSAPQSPHAEAMPGLTVRSLSVVFADNAFIFDDRCSPLQILTCSHTASKRGRHNGGDDP